jgi:hypothetical protein
MLATLVGLWLLLVLGGGSAVLAGCLLARRLRARQARRHPQQAAVREQTRQARRLAAEWPLLAQTLGLGYRDQWTRQHAYPRAESVADDQGVTATWPPSPAPASPTTSAPPRIWPTPGAVSPSGPNNRLPAPIRLRGLRRDPLLAPARVDLPGTAPASLEAWWLGWPRTPARSWSARPRSPARSSAAWPGSARPADGPSALAEHLDDYAAAEPEGLVFPSGRGTYLQRSNFSRLVWRPAVRQLGLDGLRFHDLRHTAATLAAAAGATTKEWRARRPWAGEWQAGGRLVTCWFGWSGRRESNPHRELGKLEFCH